MSAYYSEKLGEINQKVKLLAHRHCPPADSAQGLVIDPASQPSPRQLDYVGAMVETANRSDEHGITVNL